MEPGAITNNTCNGSPCPESSSSVGLAVGLTLFFLILAIVVGVIVYKYHSKMRNMLELLQTRRSQKKEDYTEAPQDDSHHYTSMIREQPTGQTPIYENLMSRSGQNKPAQNKSGFPSEPEEDVYLECDSPDDAIYSNDPACNLSILPDAQEEDVYIVPDSV